MYIPVPLSAAPPFCSTLQSDDSGPVMVSRNGTSEEKGMEMNERLLLGKPMPDE
jgi:hypothetical protein